MAYKITLLTLILAFLSETLIVDAKYHRSQDYERGNVQESFEREQNEKWRSNQPSKSSEVSRNSYRGNRKNVNPKNSQPGHGYQDDFRPTYYSKNSESQSSERYYGAGSRRHGYSKDRNSQGHDSYDRFNRSERNFSGSNRRQEHLKPKKSLCTGPNGMPMLVDGRECPLITTTQRNKRRYGNYQHKNTHWNRKY